MNKFDVNKNKLEIGDIVVLCDCAEAISREFEFWEVYADNLFTDHSVFIRGLTSSKSDSFYCECLKKVDKKYKDLQMYKNDTLEYITCPHCNCEIPWREIVEIIKQTKEIKLDELMDYSSTYIKDFMCPHCNKTFNLSMAVTLHSEIDE